MDDVNGLLQKFTEDYNSNLPGRITEKTAKTADDYLEYVLRSGKKFEGGKTYWTIAHLKWLKTLNLGGVYGEALKEYLITYDYLRPIISKN